MSAKKKKPEKKEPARRVTLVFEFEPGELEEFPLPLYDWVFGEICQNLNFGFLTTCRVDDIPEDPE